MGDFIGPAPDVPVATGRIARLSLIVDQGLYGVVPKGSLTFLGSLYKEVAKNT